MNEPSLATVPRIFRSITLLIGVLIGLFALAWAGRGAVTHDWHRDFVRFHPLIAPESNYQPTIAEMRAIVRAHCRKDQILVIVGGNSIFQGVGQPLEKLWTRRLQELLGDRYAVINFALRGSSPTDGGALVAESLREEYPKQVYLANVPPFTAASPAGGTDYRFMVFDALYKGWLLDYPPRQAAIDDYLARPDIYPEASELKLGARLDAWLRFRDFWNWWSTTQFFTFPGPLTSEWPRAFRARSKFPDREPDFEDIPLRQRFPGKGIPAEMAITRGTTAPFYETNSYGQWQAASIPFNGFAKSARDAFPEPLRARTLIVLSANAPFYTCRLSPAEQARDVLAVRDTLKIWRDHGYAAAAYGEGFVDEDFGDRTHLSASGGQKLAALLAPEIRSLAGRLGYSNP